jgi:hypothetical protein
LDEEFAPIQPDAADLKTRWSVYRDKVIAKTETRASSDSELRDLLQMNSDDLNEGNLK